MAENEEKDTFEDIYAQTLELASTQFKEIKEKLKDEGDIAGFSKAIKLFARNTYNAYNATTLEERLKCERKQKRLLSTLSAYRAIADTEALGFAAYIIGNVLVLVAKAAIKAAV